MQGNTRAHASSRLHAGRREEFGPGVCAVETKPPIPRAAATDRDLTAALTEQVLEAHRKATPLSPCGGGSKHFYGEAVHGASPLPVGDHRGVVTYEPSELVLTARAGTPLAELEALLDAHGQRIASEPPHFAGGATLGGAVAAGLSGPGRPWSGALRDHVLGVRMLDGRGRAGRYGGEVMKNVAGYDVARLMCGSLGTLGVVLEVSLKVLPRPHAEHTLLLEESPQRLHATVEAALRAGIAVTAATHEHGATRLRLGGSERAVAAAARRLGGESDDARYWLRLRDHELEFFALSPDERLWRISLPPAVPLETLPGRALLDWGGQLLWLGSDAEPARIREAASRHGGHAVLMRGPRDGVAVFPPPPPALAALQRRLKAALDPAGILNPGRMHPKA